MKSTTATRRGLRWALGFAFLTYLLGCTTEEEAPTAPAFIEDDLPRSERARVHRERLGERAVTPESEAGFKIPSPTQEVFGVDVSRWQQKIDWGTVTDGEVVFAVIKASEGTRVDRRFAENWAQTRELRAEAEARGVRRFFRGAYHFFRPLDDPAEQAHHFLRTIGPLEPGDLPPTLDIEWDWANLRKHEGDRWRRISVEERVRRARVWLEIVEAKTGRPPLIYTNYHFWMETFSDSAGFERYPLWIADYSGRSSRARKPVYLPKGFLRWTFWQFTDRGTVGGFRGPVDVNRFNGTALDLDVLSGLRQAPEPNAAAAEAPLQAGARGPRVERLQLRLVDLGYLPERVRRGGVGLFGPGTKRALTAFQKDNYLHVNGVLDELTTAAFELLEDGVGSGASGDVVRALQDRLVRSEHLDEAEVSGRLDEPTRLALVAFQGQTGLPQSGQLDPQTYRKIYGGASRSVAAVGIDDEFSSPVWMSEPSAAPQAEPRATS